MAGMESFPRLRKRRPREDDSMLSCEKNKNTLIVRLGGELDHSAASRVRTELDRMIVDSHIRRLIFDLKELRFMDSSGIGLILGRYNLLSRRGGSVAISGSNPRIERIFEMAGLFQLVERMA